MASKDGFRRVAEWVRSDGDIKAIVVSAGGKTDKGKKVTDLLLDAGKSISLGESVGRALTPFIERVLQDAESLRLAKYIKDELMTVGQEVEKDFSLDFLLSRGEYFYAKLFSLYYGIPFVDSKELIGFYEDGRLNLGLSEYRISKAYEKFGQFVCGGFYGGLASGKIKTFTRGGGDFSGAIVARGLKAKEYINFTDVDGVFSYDPKEKNAEIIKEISFDTVRLLGEFGATVLHPASVLPLYGTDMRILLKNTFNNDASGTVIVENSIEKPFAIAKRGGCSYVKALKREFGYSLRECVLNEDVKVICSASSMDFFEACYLGDLKNLDCCLQINGGVTVFYLTPSIKSNELLNSIQQLKIALFVSVFSGGIYVAVQADKESEVLQIIYES